VRVRVRVRVRVCCICTACMSYNLSPNIPSPPNLPPVTNATTLPHHSLLAQALLFCMIHRVRNGNPGYISRRTLRGWREGGSGDGTGAIAGYGEEEGAEEEKEEEEEEEEEEPPHDQDEYLFSLWLYYNSLQYRSAALAQQHGRVQSVADVRISSIGNHSNSGSGSSNGNDGNMHHRTASAEGSDGNGGNSRVYHHHQQQQQEEEEEEEDFSGRAGASTRTSATSNTAHSAISNSGSSSRGSEVKWRTGITCNVRHYCCHICRCTRLNLLVHKQQQRREQERLSLAGASASASASAATIFIPPSLNVGHSHQTHRCVTDFDHYCIFLGTDIAQQNYRMFLICTILLVMVVFPLFISATTEHVGRMSQMKREYLQSLHVIHAHMDPLHLDTNEGINSDSSKDSTNVKSGADMLKDYQKPLFLQAFLVWTLMVWMQMFFLMCFHLYCKFWRGVKARNVLQTIRSSGSQLVQQIVGVEVAGAVGAGGGSGGDGAGAGASAGASGVGYNV